MNTTTLPGTAALHDTPSAFAADAGDASHAAQEGSSEGVSELGPELGVAGFLMLLGALVVFDSIRLGAGWADDGPQSGYFPFYIGLMLLASSGVVLFKAMACWMNRGSADTSPSLITRTFVGRDELQLVMAMLVPATLYVVAMGFVGLYASSVVLIAWFMRRHGHFGWPLSAAVSVGVPLTVFMVFERWFLVPLPKGPIEAMLGF
jgi:hypothetical protein